MEKKKKSKLQIVFEIFIFSPPCDLLAAESLSISKCVIPCLWNLWSLWNLWMEFMEFNDGIYGISCFILILNLIFLGCTSQVEFRNVRVNFKSCPQLAIKVYQNTMHGSQCYFKSFEIS